MPMERHDIYLGNAPRKRKKEEEKLTFLKHEKGMLRKKLLKMASPS
jgi:hypothetical protein